MRAAPTRHHGVQYRSRTEAEWAAVLTAHAIPYQYEPITFLFDLVAPAHWLFTDAYLPDFWLPEHRLWLEVKPHAPNLIEYRKAALLAESTCCGVLISTGGPSQSDVMIFAKDLTTIQIVSTLPSRTHEQGPLKLNIDLLSEAQTVHAGPRHIVEGVIDTLQTSTAAYQAWDAAEKHEPARKRVLLLPPSLDHRADCFHSQERPGYCRTCNGTIRTFVTEESAAKLKSVRATRDLDRSAP
jgi:hypothetical protein